MSEILKTNGEIDINKLIMSLAVAIIMVLQAYQQSTQNEHSEEIKRIVPAAEIERTMEKEVNERITILERKYMDINELYENFHTKADIMHKDEINTLLTNINRRLDRVEDKK